jgi:hypothetical protein
MVGYLVLGLRLAGFVEPVVFAFDQGIDAIDGSINPIDENSILGALSRLLLYGRMDGGVHWFRRKVETFGCGLRTA